jgi:hypothetical protein
MAFDLSSIRRGRAEKPPRVIVSGAHGIGKSTFCAGAPGVVFIPTEDGIDQIDTASFPLAQSYQDVLDAVGTLASEPHDFGAVCIDSLDWLESLVWAHVAAQHEKPDVEAFGYGKGYVYAADALRELLAGLNYLRDERGMAVLLTAHCEVKRHDDPLSGSYDRYRIKLHKHASAVAQEWADVVGFAADPVHVRKEDVGFKKTVSRGVIAGERVLHVTPSPAYEAKNRYGLTEAVPLNWPAFEAAITQ